MRDIVTKYGTVKAALPGGLTRAIADSWAPFCVAIAAFVVDFFTPRSVTDFYVLPIFACLGARSPRVPMHTAALITPLLIAGFFFAPAGTATLTVSLLNRAMTFGLVWTGAILTMWRLQSSAAARDADRRKDEFLAILSHELRNPLAPIRNAAEILASTAVTRKQLQWASGVIRRQTAQMTALLDDLLELARIAQGRLSLRLEVVSFKSVLDSAIEAARPAIERKHHLLAVSTSPVESMVRADPARLRQVISNILVNAAKYTDPGGCIDLSARAVDGELCLSIKDNGIGLAPESLDHIFTLFSQADASSARIDGGIGIGLALVKGIVELHGGTVEARSGGPGRGSEFIVRLPLAAGDAGPPSVPQKAVHTAPGSSRVIVADDNVDAAESLAMLLQIEGHEVQVAHDGLSALSIARAFRPHVAILDIGMPQLDGYAVARALRKEPWGADAMVIALTGRGHEEDKRQAASAGFDVHLTKPVDPGRVASLIASVVRPEPAH